MKNIFSSFRFFYAYLANSVFLVFFFSFCVAILDGLGLSMFLPLLNMVSDKGSKKVDSSFFQILETLYGYIDVNVNLNVVLVTMVIFFVLKGAFFFIYSFYNVKLLELFSSKLRIQTLDAINSMAYEEFALTSIGRIQNGLTGEIDRIVLAFVSYFGSMQQLAMVVVYAVFAFFTDFRFALFVVLGSVLTNFLFKHLYNYTKNISKNMSYFFDVYEGKIIQHIQNFKYIKSTGYLDLFTSKLKESIFEIQKSRTELGVINSIMVAIREPILVLVIACVIFVMTTFLGSSLSLILMSLLFFYRALSSLTILQTNWNQFLMVSGSMNNIQDFLNHMAGKKERKGFKEITRFKDSIRLTDVTFFYGDTLILDKINLHIFKNKSIAFVGESGSGKSTLVNILAGLLKSHQGQMLVDDLHFEDLVKETYQKRIGYITQEPVIFNDTIFNNVTLWAERNKVNYERFTKAIQNASISNYIDSLPDNDSTVLGHSGISLSGGQRQRLSIARELYKDIDILIMDEATSALDSETEFAINESLALLHGKLTIISVAHRLSTIKNADQVVLMGHGKILGSGSFESLYHELPKFKRMVDFQEL